MIRKNLKKTATVKLPLPYSMETLDEYINRFVSSKDMMAVFPDIRQRKIIAVNQFNECWEEALVTVKKEDGTRFFIN